MNSIGILFAFLLLFAVLVALIRWALRVNDIVDRLDKIVGMMKKDAV